MTWGGELAGDVHIDPRTMMLYSNEREVGEADRAFAACSASACVFLLPCRRRRRAPKAPGNRSSRARASPPWALPPAFPVLRRCRHALSCL